MSSIALNGIIDQCTAGLLLTAGKKKPSREQASREIMNAACDAYYRRKKIEPLGAGFVISKKVKQSISDHRADLERLIPLCEKIAVLAERERGRKDLDICSSFAIGLSGAALLIPLNEDESTLMSRPAVFAVAELIGAYAIQAFKYCQFPNRGEERAELTHLWMQLDGKIPANIDRASEQMRLQLGFAKAMVNYASVRLRVDS